MMSKHSAAFACDEKVIVLCPKTPKLRFTNLGGNSNFSILTASLTTDATTLLLTGTTATTTSCLDHYYMSFVSLALCVLGVSLCLAAQAFNKDVGQCLAKNCAHKYVLVAQKQDGKDKMSTILDAIKKLES